MRIGQIQYTTLIDFPGKIACTLFTQGCNFRCGYCHNPELGKRANWDKAIPEKEFFDFLKSRTKKLEGVCITGGEPTIHWDLPKFIAKIKTLGLLVKLDTQGSRPGMVARLLDKNLVDYIAMDIKGPLERYREITNSRIEPRKVQKSVAMIMASDIPHEFRTTVVKEQLVEQDFVEIGKLIKDAQLYYLQKFKPTKCNDPSFLTKTTYTDKEFKKLAKLMEKYVEKCLVR